MGENCGLRRELSASLETGTGLDGRLLRRRGNSLGAKGRDSYVRSGQAFRRQKWSTSEDQGTKSFRKA